MNEQEKRKEKSENLLRQLGSGFLDSLPLTESEEEIKLKNPADVGSRIICLVAVAAVADGLEKITMIDWLMKNELTTKLSRKEKQFLESNELNKNDMINFLWQSECVWLLLWASQKVHRILPTEQCSIEEILKSIPKLGSDTSQFIKSIKLRPKNEILDMSDFLYRAHWATRQNYIDGSVEIGTLNPDVVQEWHLAVNWLVDYQGIDDWDEITTDT